MIHYLARYALGTSTNDSIVTPDTRTRTFRVFVPSSYNANNQSAVVFFFHGGFGSGTFAENRYGMSIVAEANNFIVVYPDGVNAAWNGGLCCGPPVTQNIDDVGFTSMMIDHLQSVLCIDSSRIFSTGMSNGAIMSHRLACQLSDRFAAIAPVEGTLMYFPCNPTNKVSVFNIHGTNDQNVPYEGGIGCGISGVYFTSIPDTVNNWTSINHCGCNYGDPSCSSMYLQQDDGICIKYGQCDNSSVILCNITNGAHSWSGAGAQASLANCSSGVGTFPATQQIWNFFSTINRPGVPSSSSPSSSPSSSAPSSPQPTNANVRIETSIFTLLFSLISLLILLQVMN